MISNGQIDLLEGSPPEMVDFFAYWSSLPKKDLIPNLSDYLDNAPAKLQPNVAIVDLYSPQEMWLRLLGTALTDVVGERTGTNANVLYNGDVRQNALSVGWMAVGHPCGYIVNRVLRTKFGHLLDVPGLALPIRTAKVGAKSLVSYNVLPSSNSGLAKDDQVETVQQFGKPAWLNIGAGVPD
jgi:hypothetical protein